MRDHMHWSTFIGVDVVISPPFKRKERYNASGMSVGCWMGEPGDMACFIRDTLVSTSDA